MRSRPIVVVMPFGHESEEMFLVGWSPRISRTPLGFKLAAPFAFSDTTAAIAEAFLEWHFVILFIFLWR